jgi:hypothetical protein
MKGKRADSINSLPYKMEMQKKGISVGPADKPRPMTANPVSKQEPGLGAATIPHPFKAGKTTI